MSPAMRRPHDPAKYADYRREISGSHLVGSLRAGILVVVGLNVPFLILDYSVFSGTFLELAAARAAVCIALGVAYFVAARWPERTMIAALLLAGLDLVLVIGLAGGVSSIYFPGIMLLFLGMPVLLPLTARQSIGVNSILFGSFAALPLMGAGAFGSQDYFVNLFFPGAAAIECIFSCALLDGLRFRDYLRRSEITAARDELAKLDDAKTRFTANVHHELRTPLTLMLAPLEGLRAGDYGSVPDGAKKTIDTMRSNGKRLLKLINNLLDLAKLEDGKFSIVRLPVDIGDLIENLVDGTRDLAEQKGISITSAVPRDLSSIYADSDALDKILINLIGNSLKFTEPGGSVRTEAEARADGVEIRVLDTGIGLAPNQVERIFDRFSQVDSSATRTNEGTGIGLSLAMELVKLHDGEIWATSDGIGHGTTMHVYLPFGEADVEAKSVALTEDGLAELESELLASDSAARSDIHMSKGKESGRFIELDSTIKRWADQVGQDPAGEKLPSLTQCEGKHRVLVVDDNSDMRELLAFILTKQFEVRTAKNGREALGMLSDFKPLLVVTDVMMPEMSGTELCERMKTSEEFSHIPIMIVSSKAEGEMKVRGLELGADDYVTKPFHPREVLARARSLVDLRVAQRELADRNEDLESALAGLQSAQQQLVQSERLAAVGEMAAGIAHEVNNPVNFSLNAARTLRISAREIREIVERVNRVNWEDLGNLSASAGSLKSWLTELGADDLSGTVEELSEIITEGLTRTQKLVGDLVSLASPGNARKMSRVDVRDGIRSTVKLIRHDYSERGLDLDIELGSEPVVVQADVAGLNQILLNLFKNAAEALDEQDLSRDSMPPCVRAFFEEREGVVAIVVQDNGPGIGSENLTNIFEPFFSTRAAGKGAGLGLYMCQAIARAHGGTIEVESTVGKGSKFSLILPKAP